MVFLACVFLAAVPLRAQTQSTSTAVGFSTATAPAEVEMTATGDIRLDGPVADIARRGGDHGPTADVAKLLAADIVFGNLETPITVHGTKTPKTWNFRAPPRLLKLLRAAGFTVLNIANNHVWDYGEQGFLDTLRALNKGRWIYIGGGRDRDEAESPRLISVRGVIVGLVGLTSTHPEQGWSAEKKPGVAYSDYDRLSAIIRRAKSRCDVLIVSFHGGTELADEPNDIQKAVAHSVINAGADMFIGHHPHVLQAVEVYNGKPILYSIGNFLFSSPSPLTHATAIARIRLDKSGIRSIAFTPLDTNYGRPRPADPRLAAAARGALNRLGALDAYPELFRFADLAARGTDRLEDRRP